MHIPHGTVCTLTVFHPPNPLFAQLIHKDGLFNSYCFKRCEKLLRNPWRRKEKSSFCFHRRFKVFWSIRYFRIWEFVANFEVETAAMLFFSYGLLLNQLNLPGGNEGFTSSHGGLGVKRLLHKRHDM